MAQCNSQAETKAAKGIIWPFWLQVCDGVLVPFIVWCSLTPTNVLNSAPGWKMLERIGHLGMAVLFFTGVLFGVIGLVKVRKMRRLRILTGVLAAVNIGMGLLLMALPVLLIAALAKGA